MPDRTMPGQSPAVLPTPGEVMRRKRPAPIHALMATSTDAFPRPVRVGTHAVRSIGDENGAWITTRPRAGG